MKAPKKSTVTCHSQENSLHLDWDRGTHTLTVSSRGPIETKTEILNGIETTFSEQILTPVATFENVRTMFKFESTPQS